MTQIRVMRVWVFFYVVKQKCFSEEYRIFFCIDARKEKESAVITAYNAKIEKPAEYHFE